MLSCFLKKNNRIIIYSILSLIAIIPCLIMWNKGFIWGHDNAFHYAQIQDLYDAFRNGDFSYYLNYETANYIGSGVRLMYGAFSHILTAIIGIVITPFGLSLTAAMKIVVFLSLLLSSFTCYKLTYKITRKQVPSILASCIFVLFPYRFCLIYVRNAYAELVALSMVPVVFLGVHGVIHDFSSSLKPYIVTIIGMVLLILTHNITAFYTAVFVGVYALFNFKKIINNMKNKQFFIKVGISIIFIASMCSWFLFALLESKSSNLYRVFDADSMRTSFELIVESSKSCMAYYNCGLSFCFATNLTFFILMSLSLSLALEFAIIYLKEKNNKHLIMFILCLVAFLGSFISSFFVYVSNIIYYSLLLVVVAYFIPFKSSNIKINKMEIYAFGVLSLISFILIIWGDIWRILPSVFYNIQFTWRLFGFLSLFLAVFIGICFALVEDKIGSITRVACALTAGCFFVMMKPNSIIEYITDDMFSWSESNSIDVEDTYYLYSTGWQLEYFTTDFLDNTPKSKFWWEVYSKLCKDDDGDYIDHPGIISGKATYSDYLYNDGVITFRLDTKEETLVEVARIYYKGYRVMITDDNGNKTELEAFNNESYVAFKTNLSGNVEIYFEKTPMINTGICLSFISGICFVGLLNVYKIKEKEVN